jgi:hypothetical protein
MEQIKAKMPERLIIPDRNTTATMKIDSRTFSILEAEAHFLTTTIAAPRIRNLIISGYHHDRIACSMMTIVYPNTQGRRT